MAEKQIISRETIQNLAKKLKETFTSKEEAKGLFGGVKYEGNTLKFYADKAASGDPIATADLPAEMVLDQAKTTFVDSFTWSEVTYPGSKDPTLDGKPVLVLAVKGEGENPNYSFLNMEKLVDTYTAGAGDGTATVSISGYEISVNVKIHEGDDNQLQKKEDGGLYVPKPASVDVSGKADKVQEAENGHLAGLDEGGNLTDSGIAASAVLTEADIQDFTEAEIGELLAAE